MFKYEMTINNEAYTALFINHDEANDFINELRSEEEAVKVNTIQTVTAIEVLNNSDKNLEWSYCVEMAYTELFPNDDAIHTMKINELEDLLILNGYINHN